MQWTDRIRRVKIILIATAVVIAVASLMVSHFLTSEIASQEHERMELWAEAMRTLNNADENTDLNLVLKVLNENNYIPLIVMDSNGNVTDYRNVKLKGEGRGDSLRYAAVIGGKYKEAGHSIRIILDRKHNEYIDVCYGESLMLRRLAVFPIVQLIVVLGFLAIAVFALLAYKRSEQNKVWAGLSKETAHQLGTPISSLMAWVEVLKAQYPDESLIQELDKDVNRLQLISDRFSKIGSEPEFKPTNLSLLLNRVYDYMSRRLGRNLQLITRQPQHEIVVNANAELLGWVIENLCKNAADAIGGEPGKITISVEEMPGKVAIEVSDTGKGIRRKDINNVFKPGFTTKKRGWGLGLSLAKRIVEEYHKGKIWVKSSEVGSGTTFRIELNL